MNMKNDRGSLDLRWLSWLELSGEEGAERETDAIISKLLRSPRGARERRCIVGRRLQAGWPSSSLCEASSVKKKT